MKKSVGAVFIERLAKRGQQQKDTQKIPIDFDNARIKKLALTDGR